MIYLSYLSLLLVSACMIRFAYTDFKSSIIENRDLLIFLLFTIIFHFSSRWITYDAITLISIIGSVLYWTLSFFYKDGQAFGGGDLKMLVIMAFLFPPYIYWQIVFLGFLLSLVGFLPWGISKLLYKWLPLSISKPNGIPLAVPMMFAYFIIVGNVLISLYI